MPFLKRLRQTSPDKVNGKLVKFRAGDCLSIDCKNGNYIAVFVYGKFNAYYLLTLIEYYKTVKPQLPDFIRGKFFGTRFGSWEDLTYAVAIRMIKCKYIDSCDVEKVGDIKIKSSVTRGSYSYDKSIEMLLDIYLEELPIRLEKSKNAEKFPDLAFLSKHLVDVKNIIE